MAESIVMIALSPTMQDGMISTWLVTEGQSVKPGDALCEIETDKATMPYESPKAGVLLKIIKTAGQKANVGETIAVMGKAGEDWKSVATTIAPPKSESLKPATVAENPATAPAAAPQKSNAAAFPALGPIPAAQNAPAYPASLPPSSPLARKIARDRGIDLRTLVGSGPHGRVVARDIVGSGLSHDLEKPVYGTASLSGAASLSRGATVSGGASLPAITRLRSDRVPLSKMRSIIADRLGTSWAQAPHFFVRAAVDMENLLTLRAAVNTGRDKKLGLNSFIMRIATAALEHHPIINASWEGDAIRYLPSADIGLAVALDGGLITPVVRSCESKGIEAIDAELADLVARARSGGLLPEEYSGASFTISNLGSFGVEEFTAIINPPGSAILALGATAKEAVVRGDEIVARNSMRITLSSDHRVIDGAVAAAFVSELKSLLEEPGKALL